MTTTLTEATSSETTTRPVSGGRRLWRTGAVSAVLIPALASGLSD